MFSKKEIESLKVPTYILVYLHRMICYPCERSPSILFSDLSWDWLSCVSELLHTATQQPYLRHSPGCLCQELVEQYSEIVCLQLHPACPSSIAKRPEIISQKWLKLETNSSITKEIEVKDSVDHLNLSELWEIRKYYKWCHGWICSQQLDMSTN